MRCSCGNETDEFVGLDDQAEYLKGFTICKACAMHNDKSAIFLESQKIVDKLAKTNPYVEQKYKVVKNLTEKSELEEGKDYLIRAGTGDILTRYLGGKDNMFIPYDQTKHHHHQKNLFRNYDIEEFVPKEHKKVGLLTFRFMNFGSPLNFLVDRMVNMNLLAEIKIEEEKEQEKIDWGGLFD